MQSLTIMLRAHVNVIQRCLYHAFDPDEKFCLYTLKGCAKPGTFVAKDWFGRCFHRRYAHHSGLEKSYPRTVVLENSVRRKLTW